MPSHFYCVADPEWIRGKLLPLFDWGAPTKSVSVGCRLARGHTSHDCESILEARALHGNIQWTFQLRIGHKV